MTDEDRKLIFEFGGFSYFDDWYYLYQDALCISRFSGETDPDMDWYFKYARPKIEEKRGHLEYFKFLLNWIIDFTGKDKDPAEAFGQALLKLIKED
ncbi:hypothetical protein LCGC14_2495280 [marine sediment metagenome]|uniref:Uncharacterized protein n=1 Tax=marine sediment metagenome TaxID=412755 RepID=A0A0F9B483_9ZZZZ